MRFMLRRPDVADGDELEELRVVLADEDAALVAAADQCRLDRLAAELLVAEIAGRPGDGGRPAGDGHALEEAAAGQVVGNLCEVRLAVELFVRGQVEGHESDPFGHKPASTARRGDAGCVMAWTAAASRPNQRPVGMQVRANNAIISITYRLT